MNHVKYQYCATNGQYLITCNILFIDDFGWIQNRKSQEDVTKNIYISLDIWINIFFHTCAAKVKALASALEIVDSLSSLFTNISYHLWPTIGLGSLVS